MSVNRFFCQFLISLILLTFISSQGISAEGDPARGKALFTGNMTFAEGGAPCLACHGIAGVGFAGNSNYGPDLTTIHENYGAEGITAILQSMPFPSMEAIYVNRPLTETEQLDLTAYFSQTSQLSVVPGNKALALQVICVVVVILGLTFLLGLRRMRTSRQPLINRQRNLKNKGDLQ